MKKTRVASRIRIKAANVYAVTLLADDNNVVQRREMDPRSGFCSAAQLIPQPGARSSKKTHPPHPLRAKSGLFLFTSLWNSQLHAAKASTFALLFTPKIAWRKEVCRRQAEKQGGGAHGGEDLS